MTTYARKSSSSDVHIRMHPMGHLECHGCSLRDGELFQTRTHSGMYTHLKRHEASDDTVEPSVFTALWNVIKANWE